MASSKSGSKLYLIKDVRYYTGKQEYLICPNPKQYHLSYRWLSLAEVKTLCAANDCVGLFDAFTHWYNYSREGMPPNVTNYTTYNVTSQTISTTIPVSYCFNEFVLPYASDVQSCLLQAIQDNKFNFSVGFNDGHRNQLPPDSISDKTTTELNCFRTVLDAWHVRQIPAQYALYHRIVGRNVWSTLQTKELATALSRSHLMDNFYSTPRETIKWINLRLNSGKDVIVICCDQHGSDRNLSSFFLIRRKTNGLHVDSFNSYHPWYCNKASTMEISQRLSESLRPDFATRNFNWELSTNDSLFRCLLTIARLFDGEQFDDLKWFWH